MNFLYPAWFYALIFIPVILIAKISMRSSKNHKWQQMVGTKHRKRLISKSSELLRWISFSIALVALAGFIIAMARPYKGQTQIRDKVKTRNILISVDCSLSMLCKDGDSANTDRLSTAKAIAIKLVDSFPDDHIGVMAFAGSANMISSITIDHPSVKQTLDQIDIYSAHTLGSNFNDSVTQSIKALANAGKSANALILITDGTEDTPDITDLAQQAKQAQVQIFTIGVGSPAGGFIPIQTNNGTIVNHKDQHGRAVVTKLDDSSLRQLATQTSAIYSHASSADRMIADSVKKMNQFEKEGRVREVPDELYQWFLAPGILLLIISVLLRVHWRKTPPQTATVASTLLITFFLPTQSDAQHSSMRSDSFVQQINHSLFEKPQHIREGYKALEKKDYELAIKHFRSAIIHSSGEEHADLSLALAQAHYRIGDYSEATKAYADATISADKQTQINAQYNMANALFKAAVSDLKPTNDVPFKQYLEQAIRGHDSDGVEKLTDIDYMKQKLSDSIIKYADTLETEPTHSPSLKNKRIAEDLLKTIKDIQDQIKEEEEEKKKQNSTDKEEETEEKDDQKKEENSEKNQPEKKQNKNNEQGETSENTNDSNKENSDQKGEQHEANQEKQNGQDSQTPDTASSTDNNSKDLKNSKQTPIDEKKEQGDFANEKEALEFMERMSDQRKKPHRMKRGWLNSEKDW